MILLNFSHATTGDQIAEMERMAGQPILRECRFRTQFDPDRSFAGQAQALIEELLRTVPKIDRTSVIVILPSLNTIACIVLTELHGLLGHFPTIVRIAPVDAGVVPNYRVAELIVLQTLRDTARTAR